MKCPLKNFQYSTFLDCQGEACAFADEAGNCLIRQALQCYVSAERTRVAEEADRIRRETELAQMYWATKKDGIRTPIQFSHQPVDEKHPHGGVYEDLSDLREEFGLTPRIDGSYINF